METQLKTFGFIFEQMCARDLRAYTPGFGNHLSYYRDRYGLEAYGLEIVENVPIEIAANPYNERYLRTTAERMGHTLHLNK